MLHFVAAKQAIQKEQVHSIEFAASYLALRAMHRHKLASAEQRNKSAVRTKQVGKTG